MTKDYKKIFTTNARFGNTRLSDNSRIRAILEFHHPHYLHHSAKVNAPAIRLLRLASVVGSKPKKKKNDRYEHKLMHIISVLKHSRDRNTETQERNIESVFEIKNCLEYDFNIVPP